MNPLNGIESWEDVGSDDLVVHVNPLNGIERLGRPRLADQLLRALK